MRSFIRIFARVFFWQFSAGVALVVLVVLHRAYAQAIDCATACTVTIVHDFQLLPFQIDTEDGTKIAGAVLAVWAVGWGARMVIRALNVDSVSSTESEK